MLQEEELDDANMMDTEVAFKLAKFSFKNAIKSNIGLSWFF